MKRKLLFITLLIITICSFIRNGYSQKTQISDNLYGTYQKGASDLGTQLVLNNDGTFLNKKYIYSDYVQKGEPGAWFTEVSGNLIIDSNTVRLYPEIYMTKKIYHDSVVITDSLKYYESDSTSIKTVFTIVNWNSNIYLLSESPGYTFGYRMDNDFVRFANNYNSGSEPKWPQSYFVKRLNKIRFEKIDSLQIPVKWRKYFLDSMIYVVVSNIEKNIFYDSIFEVYINRYILKGGSKNGIQEGMVFYGKDGCCILKIYEVFEQSSIGIIELCPYNQNSCSIGDTLVSWNEKDNGKYVH